MKQIVILYKGQQFSFPVTPKLYRRFLAKFTKGQPDECWEWKAAISQGYGELGFSLGKIDGKLVPIPVRAHRVSYQIYVGSLGALSCLHTCDNKLCVNPGHLFKGTQLANIHDAIDKGLILDKRRLSFPQAQEIRRIYVPYSKEFGCRALGKKYGIPFQHISEIIHRKTYNRPWNPAMI